LFTVVIIKASPLNNLPIHDNNNDNIIIPGVHKTDGVAYHGIICGRKAVANARIGGLVVRVTVSFIQ